MILENRQILFVTTSESPHLDRFIAALTVTQSEVQILLLQVEEFEESISNYCVEKKFTRDDIILVMPIESFSEKFWAQNKSRVFYISLAYDILNLNLEESDAVINSLRNSLEKANGLILDCATVHKALKDFNVRNLNSLVIPYGINFYCAPPSFKDKEGTNEISISALRNWTDLHNQDLAIEIVREIAKTRRVVLNVAGMGEKKEILLSSIVDSNITINDFGSVNEVKISEILSGSDIYLASSKIDGSSITLLQAMYFGAIPVVFDNDSNREWIRPGENGYLFNSKSDGVEKINRLIDLFSIGDAQLIRMREKSKSTIEIAANWQLNAIKLREFLKI
jgi:glycosyltransferase involved in cell wall biosynthesis